MTENSKPSDWQDLLRIAQGSQLVVERIRLPEKQITIEGTFVLPELSRLTVEDQVFVTAFCNALTGRSRKWSRPSASATRPSRPGSIA